MLAYALTLLSATASTNAGNEPRLPSSDILLAGTTSAEARRLVQEGLFLHFSFARTAALDRFRRAARLDPTYATPRWGEALALGPNINAPGPRGVDGEIHAALAAAAATVTNAAQRTIISALARRYSLGPERVDAAGYSLGVHPLIEKYENDQDIQALVFEADIEALRANPDLTDEEVIAMDKRSARLAARWPENAALQHYNVHELGDQTALTSANMLSSLALPPEASHLKHMGSHIYYVVGQWQKIQHDNRIASEMDETVASRIGVNPDRIEYHLHNVDFWYGAAIMTGNACQAEAAASKFYPSRPEFRILVAARLGKYAEAAGAADAIKIASLPQSAWREKAVAGLAYASVGRGDDARIMLRQLSSWSDFRAVLISALVEARMKEASNDLAGAASMYEAAFARSQEIPFEALQVWYFAPLELESDMYLRKGEWALARATALRELRIHPHSVPALRVLAKASTLSENKTEAAKANLQLSVFDEGLRGAGC